MKERPLRTTVIGSYPFPGWLEFACAASRSSSATTTSPSAGRCGDRRACTIRSRPGSTSITDGEQTRLDFNLSFYGSSKGSSWRPRRRGASARRRTTSAASTRSSANCARRAAWARWRNSSACSGSRPRGPDAQGQRARALHAERPAVPNERYPDRYALTEALLPIVRAELEALVAAGCREITVDEPSMSCYAHREDPRRFVDIFNRTVEPVVGKCRLSTHLCFGNYKGRAVGPRRYAPMFPAFLELNVDEIHVEMASREFAEIEIIGADRAAQGRRGRHHRREELLHRDAARTSPTACAAA